MSKPTKQEMFEWAEKQRARASSMTDEELANHLLIDVFGSVQTAWSEFASTPEADEEYELSYGVIREAAFRLAKVKSYE